MNFTPSAMGRSRKRLISAESNWCCACSASAVAVESPRNRPDSLLNFNDATAQILGAIQPVQMVAEMPVCGMDDLHFWCLDSTMQRIG